MYMPSSPALGTAGNDPRVPYPQVLEPEVFRSGLETDMRGVRIGWSRDFGIGLPVESEIVEHLERQLAVFEDLGAIVEEAAPDFREADLVFGNTRALDFAAGPGPIVERSGHLIKPEVRWSVAKGWRATTSPTCSCSGGAEPSSSRRGTPPSRPHSSERALRRRPCKAAPALACVQQQRHVHAAGVLGPVRAGDEAVQGRHAGYGDVGDDLVVACDGRRVPDHR